jgi:hypothetical protein
MRCSSPYRTRNQNSFPTIYIPRSITTEQFGNMTTILPQSNSSALFLKGRRHVNDYDVPLKEEEAEDHGLIDQDAKTEPRSSTRRKLQMAGVLRRLSRWSLQQVVGYGETSDSDNSFYCEDDDLSDSIHLTKTRYGSRKNSICSSTCEAKSVEELLKDNDALASPPRSLPSD